MTTKTKKKTVGDWVKIQGQLTEVQMILINGGQTEWLRQNVNPIADTINRGDRSDRNFNLLALKLAEAEDTFPNLFIAEETKKQDKTLKKKGKGNG